MSGFGRPGGQKLTFNPTPPERGSFPLDHDGECKSVMTDYLACLKRVKGTNEDACRMLAKDYLKCRMANNLMTPGSMQNLGFHDEKSKKEDQEKQMSTTPTKGQEPEIKW